MDYNGPNRVCVPEPYYKGILESVDMDTYRAEIQASSPIELDSGAGEIDPVPLSGSDGKTEPKLDYLSNILKTFNEQFGNLFDNPEEIEETITEELPAKVEAGEAYQNAKQNADKETAFYEMKRAFAAPCSASSMTTPPFTSNSAMTNTSKSS